MTIPPDLVGDNFDFFQDQTELAMDSRGEYRTHWFLGGRQSTRQSAEQDLDLPVVTLVTGQKIAKTDVMPVI